MLPSRLTHTADAANQPAVVDFVRRRAARARATRPVPRSHIDPGSGIGVSDGVRSSVNVNAPEAAALVPGAARLIARTFAVR